MSLALVENAVNGAVRPCAIAGCERHGAIAEARHHGRAPEWIWICPQHREAHEAADTCQSPGCPARAVQWGLCGRHQADRRLAWASALGAALATQGPPTQATAEDRDRILSRLREAGAPRSISALQLGDLTRAQVRDALSQLQERGLARPTSSGWEAVAADPPAEPARLASGALDLRAAGLSDRPEDWSADSSSDSSSNSSPISADSPAAPAQEPPMPAPILPPRDAALALIRAEPGIPQAQVAGRLGIQQSPASAILRTLEAAGLIERRREAPTERPGYLGLALYPAGHPASEPAPPEPIPETRLPPLVRVRVPPLPALPEGEEPGGDCDGSEPLPERAENLERQLRERSDDLAACGRALGCEDPTEGREVVRRAEAAARVREELGVALRERTQERDAARAGLEQIRRAIPGELLPVNPTAAEMATAIGLRIAVADTDAREKADLESRFQARFEETRALRTEIAEARAALDLAPGASLLSAILAIRAAATPEPRWVETAEGSWDLQVLRPVSVAEADRVEGGFEWICGEESGTAPTLERAQRRAEQAAGEGAQ